MPGAFMRFRTHNGVISIKMHIRAHWDSAHRGECDCGFVVRCEHINHTTLKRFETRAGQHNQHHHHHHHFGQAVVAGIKTHNQLHRVPYEDEKRAQLRRRSAPEKVVLSVISAGV